MAALFEFSRINEVVLVRPPTVKGPPSARAQSSSKEVKDTTPETILFLSWGDADARHIEKYTNIYTKLYPRATVVLVRGGILDFLYRTEATQRKLVSPAVKILTETDIDTLLIHVMSNAGSKQWSTISKLYFATTERALSNATTIIDSAPGRFGFKQNFTALSRSLPRAFLPRIVLGFVFGFILSVIHLGSFLLPGPDTLEVVRRELNSTSGTVKGARRCYVYSDTDDIILKEDVEDHAKEAEEKGWAVDLVKFQGSTHVGHFKHDPKQYLEAIERTWSGRSR